MISNSALSATFWSILAATLLTSVYGLAAFWAAWPRASWLARWAPLAILLAALAPLGAYELVAFNAAQAAVIVVGVFLARSVQSRRASRRVSDPGSDAKLHATAPPVVAPPGAVAHRPQFTLVDVLQGVVLAAAVFALLRLAAPSSAVAFGSPIEWWPWIATGSTLGLAALAEYWVLLVWPARGWWTFAARTVCILALSGMCVGVSQLSGLGPGYFLEIDSPLYFLGIFFGAVLLANHFTVAALALSRRAGWSVVSPPQICEETERAPSKLQRAGRWRQQWVARAVLTATVVAGVWVLGSFYHVVFPGNVPSDEPLPQPNGYEQVVHIASLLNWTAIPMQDVDEATPADCQAFAAANAPLLARARTALEGPSRCPVDYSMAAIGTSQLVNIQGFRELARAMAAETRAREAAGKRRDALKCDLGIIALGNEAGRGGLWVDDLVGDAVQWFGTGSMVKQLPTLSAADLSFLIPQLERLIAAREPVEFVVEREARLPASDMVGLDARQSGPLPNSSLQRKTYACWPDTAQKQPCD